MISCTNISSKGIVGSIKCKRYFNNCIFQLLFLLGLKMIVNSLEKTMTALDKNLDQAGKILDKFLK